MIKVSCFPKLASLIVLVVLCPGGHCYSGRLKYIAGPAKVSTAIELCCNESMALVTIEDANEHERVKDFIRNNVSDGTESDIWIGLIYNVTTKKFHWMIDGSVTNYTDWTSGEPNHMPPDGDSEYVRIEKRNWQFKTIRWSMTYAILCEETESVMTTTKLPGTTKSSLLMNEFLKENISRPQDNPCKTIIAILSASLGVVLIGNIAASIYIMKRLSDKKKRKISIAEIGRQKFKKPSAID